MGEVLAGGCGWGGVGNELLGGVELCGCVFGPSFSFLFNVFSCVYLLIVVSICCQEDWMILCFWLLMACVLFTQLMYILIVYMNEFWLETSLIPRVQ